MGGLLKVMLEVQIVIHIVGTISHMVVIRCPVTFIITTTILLFLSLLQFLNSLRPPHIGGLRL